MIHPLKRMFAVVVGLFCITPSPLNNAHAQESGDFYNSDEDEEITAVDEKKVIDFFGLPSDYDLSDASQEIVLEVETEEETRIANEKFRRELEEEKRIKAQKDRIGSQDYFSGINVQSGGNVAPAPKPVNPKNVQNANQAKSLISLDSLRLQVISKFGSPPNTKPNPKLVHIAPMNTGVHVERGSVVELDIGYVRSGDSIPSRKILLWSKLNSPRHKLPNETLYELGIYPDDGDELVWEKSTESTWSTWANITKKSSFTQKILAGDKRRHKGYVQIQTAILKPGDYLFWVKIYRKKNDQTVETDVKTFNFKVVDAPLHIESNIPTALASYNPDRNIWTGEYSAQISDWAIRPMKGKITSNVPGFSLPYDGEINETIFDFSLRPSKRFIGRNQSFTLKVTDGLGRTATLRRSVSITDSASSEIKVNMASTVNAGGSISGTVTYPAGFTLSKKPRIGDPRGFKWTSSDYTSFRIDVNEEGVHHKRLFAIVASGKMDGVGEEQVLTWKREYNVKSQNLIYDEARNRRRTEANNKAWNDAFSALASGVGAAASAYADAATVNASGNNSYASGGSSGEYETEDVDDTVSAGRSDSDTSSSYGGLSSDEVGVIWERTQSSPPSSSKTTPSNSASDSSSSSSGVRPQGISGQLDFSRGEPTNICGVDTTNGEWQAIQWDGLEYDYKFGYDFGDPNAKVFIVKITRKKPVSGTTRHKSTSFYTKNCVVSYQYNPKLEGYDNFTFWDNGGKKKEEIEGRYTKEWDRSGRLLEHWPKGAVDKDICSNSNQKYRNCS